MKTHTLQALFALAVAATTLTGPLWGQDVPGPGAAGDAELVVPQPGSGAPPADGQIIYENADGTPANGPMVDGPMGDGFGPMYGPNPNGQYIYTRIGVMFMDRSVSRRVDFTSLGVNGPHILSTRDMDFEFEAASRFVLGVPVTPDVSIEAIYFGLQNWEEEFAFATDGFGLFSVYSNFGLIPAAALLDADPSNNGFVDTDRSNIQAISYNTHLENAELNANHRISTNPGRSDLWIIGGFRYLRLQERFDYFTAGATDTSLSRVTTDNDLIGFQLGGMAQLHAAGRFHIDATYKAGIYVNLGEQRTLTTAVIPGTLEEQASDDSLAWVSDAALTGTYDASSWCSLTFGYYVLGIDGVALAPENFNFGAPGSVFRIPPRIDQHGTVIYHGATAGLEIRW